MPFQNRKHAGQLLAAKVLHLKAENPILLALPRGGVSVAAEIAKELEIPLEVLVVRKIGSPFSSEVAVGAICEHAEPIFSDYMLAQMGLNPDSLKAAIQQEKKEVDRQLKEFRNNRPLNIARKTVILVDDGLATGATMLAAIQCMNKKGAKKIVVAVPVAAALMAQSLRKKVDEVIAVEERNDLWSISRWYEDFTQVSDEDVKRSLSEFRAEDFNNIASVSSAALEKLDNRLSQ